MPSVVTVPQIPTSTGSMPQVAAQPAAKSSKAGLFIVAAVLVLLL